MRAPSHPTSRSHSRLLCTGLAVAGLALAAPAGAQTPPDLTVCDGVTCDDVQGAVCSAAGFKVTLTDFTAPSTSSSGEATYTYEICSPAAGVCDGLVRFGESCLDNDFCRRKGQNEDPPPPAAASAPPTPSAA